MTKKKNNVIMTAAGPIRITPKLETFIGAICDGNNIKDAAKIARYSERHARRQAATPQVRALVKMQARSIIADASPRMARRLVNLALQDESKAVAKDACIAALGIEGIQAPRGPAVQINNYTGPGGYVIMSDEDQLQMQECAKLHGPQAGYIIDLREPAKQIEHAQEEAKDG